jgi:hypothetical protein
MKKVSLALFLSWLTIGCSKTSPEYMPYASASIRFAAEVPSDWVPIESPQGATPGVQFLAPPSKGEKTIRPYVSVDYYPSDDARFASADEFISDQTKPLPDRTYGPVIRASVGGLPAKEFTATRPLPQSPEFSTKGELLTRTVLVTTAHGFYVLAYAAPKQEATAHAAVFQRLLSSFQPR